MAGLINLNAVITRLVIDEGEFFDPHDARYLKRVVDSKSLHPDALVCIPLPKMALASQSQGYAAGIGSTPIIDRQKGSEVSVLGRGDRMSAGPWNLGVQHGILSSDTAILIDGTSARYSGNHRLWFDGDNEPKNLEKAVARTVCGIRVPQMLSYKLFKRPDPKAQPQRPVEEAHHG